MYTRTNLSARIIGSMSWSRLPPAVQALHAELLQLALTDAAMRTDLGLRGGTIVSKEIKGRRYLYLQRTWGGLARLPGDLLRRVGETVGGIA